MKRFFSRCYFVIRRFIFEKNVWHFLLSNSNGHSFNYKLFNEEDLLMELAFFCKVDLEKLLELKERFYSIENRELYRNYTNDELCINGRFIIYALTYFLKPDIYIESGTGNGASMLHSYFASSIDGKYMNFYSFDVRRVENFNSLSNLGFKLFVQPISVLELRNINTRKMPKLILYFSDGERSKAAEEFEINCLLSSFESRIVFITNKGRFSQVVDQYTTETYRFHEIPHEHLYEGACFRFGYISKTHKIN